MVNQDLGKTLVERYALGPEAIEAKSFQIVADLLPPLDCSLQERQVITRVVHATGDPAVAASVRFHPQAVAAGMEALRRGATIFTDVRMVQMGITREVTSGFGCQVRCAIDDPEVAAKAKEWGTTRAIAAMRHFADDLSGSIVAIGNAPTALLALLDMVDAGQARPALIVGVPVGFVASAESKAELMRRNIPFISVEGYRGGSPVAAAIINALYHLARPAE
ncbi:MAG: Precorrin-8X methylmutase [Dehalococcoidia bacterium]|nr:Precorrin-8X methylmutase [Dehalococcoidia bacterium]